MSKIAIITDTHAGIRSDSSWMAEYQKKFYDDIFFPVLKKENVQTVFHLGDVFDNRKSININTLQRTMNCFLKPLMNYEVYFVMGNHDVFYKDTNNVNSLELILKDMSDNFHVVDAPTEVGDFLMIPWITSDNQTDILNEIKTTTKSRLCGHLELVGFDMSPSNVSTHGMDSKIFNKFKSVWTGHYHQESKKGNVHYLGAPMEFTWADAGQSRGFFLFDTETGELEKIENPYSLHMKFYYNNEIAKGFDFSIFENKIIKFYVEDKQDKKEFEKFMEKLGGVNHIHLSVYDSKFEMDLTASNANVSFENIPTTETLINEYVDNADTDLDKDKMKACLNNAYKEALDLVKND